MQGLRLYNGFRFNISLPMGVRPFRCSSCDKSDQNKSNLETYKKRALLKWNKIDKCFFGPIIKRQGGLTKDSSSSDSPRITPANVERTKPIPAGLWCQLAVGRYGKKRQLMRSLSSAVSLPPETVVVPTLPDQPFFHKDNMIVPFPMFLDKSVDNVSHTEEIFSLPGPEFKLPSVTQILRDTMPKESEVFLNVWRKRKIAEIGEEGFKTYMRDALSVGKLLHASIETRLRGVSYDAVHVEPRVSGHWLSLKSILSNVDEVRVLESCVVHQHLKYKGFVDCVARYKDQLVAIEWKTSQRAKNTLQQAYDDPIQIAAYVGAINADSNYPFEVDGALLVVAYPTGKPADVLPLDREKCEYYWFEWLRRLEKFNQLRAKQDGCVTS